MPDKITNWTSSEYYFFFLFSLFSLGTIVIFHLLFLFKDETWIGIDKGKVFFYHFSLFLLSGMILTFLFLFISLGTNQGESWMGIGEGKVFLLSFFIIFVVLAFGNDTNVPFSFLFFRDEFHTKVNGGWWFFLTFF